MVSVASPSVARAAAPAQTAMRPVEVLTGKTGAKLSWRATEGAGVGGWAVEYGCYSGFSKRVVHFRRTQPAGTREFIVRNLLPGRTYTAKVYPFVTDKKSGRLTPAPLAEPVPPVTLRVGEQTGDVPAAVPVRAAADASRVRVSWHPSPDPRVAGYELARQGPDDKEMRPFARLTVNQLTPTLELFTGGRRRAVRPDGLATVVDADVEAGAEYTYGVRCFTDDDPPKRSDATRVTVTSAPCTPGPDNVLIVWNPQKPGAREIVLAYCRARGIQKPHNVKLDLGPKAAVRMHRPRFETHVLAPVRAALRDLPQVTHLVLVRGVPHLVRESGHSMNPARYQGWDRAATDSELMLARYDTWPLDGRLRNPLFGRVVTLTPVDRLLAVCRLDGAEVETAADLGRRAVEAEERGVEGIAFFDARGLKKGGYAVGDRWIRKAAQIARADGRLTVKMDDTEEVVDFSQTRQRIGFYYGWYRTHWQPKNKAFRFGRGAVAAHLHSYAGNWIIQDKNWVGELLHHGATAALGVATEPLLDGFPAPDPLVENLLAGRTLGEAFLASCRYVSWMPICVGDPLYRPFEGKEKGGE
jgi:uncharacterized protein (TIGR03790 family)